MRLRYVLAALLIGLAATASAAAPAAAATSPACAFSPTIGGNLVTSTLTSPGVYTGNFFFGATPSCGSPYPSDVHAETTFHLTVNGVAQPDSGPNAKDCSSPDPTMCLPFWVTALKGLNCDVTYNWEGWVSATGWYQLTATSPKVTIAPVTGPHRTGTTFHPSVCK
jgi:hypothetical protein